MNLYFLRHAIALDRSAWHGPDGDRPLTKEGIQKMRKTAKGMKRLGLTFDWILTSPYRRAYDTAQIVAAVYKKRNRLRVVRSLRSEGDPRQLLLRLAREYLIDDSLLLVGHEPYLSRFISILIGARETVAIDYRKGGLCKLTADALTYGPCARLEWLLTPKLIKRLS